MTSTPERIPRLVRLLGAAMLALAVAVGTLSIAPVSAADNNVSFIPGAGSAVKDLAVDSQNRIVFVQLDSHLIYRMDAATGEGFVIAGTGVRGFSGDGGHALEAQFDNPSRITVDANDNIFVADEGNLRIRRIDATTGVVTTVIGNGGLVPSPPSVLAQNAATGIVSDLTVAPDGSLWFANAKFGMVHRVNLGNGMVTRVAGTGITGAETPGLQATETKIVPVTIDVDADGNLYYLGAKSRVYRVDAVTGILSVVAGTGVPGYSPMGGKAIETKLPFPKAIELDPAGFLYITGYRYHPAIQRVDLSTGIIETIVWQTMDAIDFGPEHADFSVQHLFVDEEGTLTFADPQGSAFRQLNNSATAIPAVVEPLEAGEIVTEVGDTPSWFIERRIPWSEDHDGGGYEASIVFDRNGNPRVFGSSRLAIASSGDIFLATTFRNSIEQIDASSEQSQPFAGRDDVRGSTGNGGPAAEASLAQPTKIAFDQDENLLVVEAGAHVVRRIDSTTGIITKIAGTTGSPGFSGDGGPADSAKFTNPFSIAVDIDGSILVADTGNYRIRRIDAATGIVTTIAGDGSNQSTGDGGLAVDASIGAATAIAVDGAGNIFFSEAMMVILLTDDGWVDVTSPLSNPQSVVRRIDRATGIIETIAGPGNIARGDGGPAIDAVLEDPTDLMIDHEGDLWISTRNSLRRVKQAAVPVPQLTFDPGFMCAGLEVTIELDDGDVPTFRHDVIRGTAGPDVIDGADGNDVICGLGGDDIITGGEGADKIYGGAGDDRINGGSGNDRLVGGLGDDLILGDNGNDRVFGGLGRDDLRGGNGKDRIAGGKGNDVLRGEGHDDELLGNQGRDRLIGGNGDDILRGGLWIDSLDGGPQNDACATIDGETRVNCERGLFGLK